LVGIAGHGPFSHLFDGKLMPRMKMSWKVNDQMTVKGSPIVASYTPKSFRYCYINLNIFLLYVVRIWLKTTVDLRNMIWHICRKRTINNFCGIQYSHILI